MRKRKPKERGFMGCREPLPREEEDALVRLAQAGDCAARNAVVEANLPLVYGLAGRYKVGAMEKDDLVQDGVLGADPGDPRLRSRPGRGHRLRRLRGRLGHGRHAVLLPRQLAHGCAVSGHAWRLRSAIQRLCAGPGSRGSGRPPRRPGRPAARGGSCPPDRPAGAPRPRPPWRRAGPRPASSRTRPSAPARGPTRRGRRRPCRCR